jgi:hypothetical protein
MKYSSDSFQANQSILDFLGIRGKDITACTIFLRPNVMPTIRVTSTVRRDGLLVIDGEHIRTETQRFRLEPVNPQPEISNFDLDAVIAAALARVSSGIAHDAKCHISEMRADFRRAWCALKSEGLLA